jgi:hypothetical protein
VVGYFIFFDIRGRGSLFRNKSTIDHGGPVCFCLPYPTEFLLDLTIIFSQTEINS